MQCASERERQKRMGTNYALPPLIVLDNLRPESKMIGLPRSKRLAAGTAKALKHNLGCLYGRCNGVSSMHLCNFSTPFRRKRRKPR